MYSRSPSKHPARRLCTLAAVVCLFLPLSCPGQTSPQPAPASPGLDVRLPLQPKSVRFAVIGDTGTGDRHQYEVAKQLEAYRQVVGFDFVIMLGDNIYGGKDPHDFAKKFETPYKPLLDAGVKFYASLGNHDDPNLERLYKPFNMGGERYYTFKKGPVAFFALDSNYMDPKQLSWLEKNLAGSGAQWKICFFHHPLYNVGESHGPDLDLRAQLVPIFQKYGVNVVFSGHEHVYERLKAEAGIHYFVQGNSAKLMSHDLPQSDKVDADYDAGRGFMLVEIAGDDLYFQAINESGKTIDAGKLARQGSPDAENSSR